MFTLRRLKNPTEAIQSQRPNPRAKPENPQLRLKLEIRTAVLAGVVAEGAGGGVRASSQVRALLQRQQRYLRSLRQPSLVRRAPPRALSF
jgi:vacuolar-type H+-ATPase subunit E/Vma4